MARTRTQIKAAVGYNTGRATEKATLIETLCDEALKVAIGAHPFRGATTELTDIAITEDATSVDISAVLTTTLVNIVTARIVDASGPDNTILIMKSRDWWDRNVVNAEDNMKGRPEYGHRYGTTVLLNRPAESGLELRLVVSQEATFASDATTCPVAILDTFVVQYATAFVFLSIENEAQFIEWKRQALGPQWDQGIVGGSLLQAINTDKFDVSEEFQAERDVSKREGTSILNNDSTHDDYGQIRSWY